MLYLRKAYNLTEDDIRYAMAHSKSNAGAARFLRINLATYRKYASQYIDKETGLTLYELHKNKAGKDIPVIRRVSVQKHQRLLDLLEGRSKNYTSPSDLKDDLIREGFLDESCALCGFNERRITDYTVPLTLNFKDGDMSNCKYDNLELLCYNCYYLVAEGKRRIFVK